MNWKINFYGLEGSNATIVSGRTEGENVILQLSADGTDATGITYLDRRGVTGPYVINQEGHGLLSFHDFPISNDIAFLNASLYSNCNYTGNSILLNEGAYPNITNEGFANDVLSSLRIPAGLQVVLYQHYNFGGSSITFTADDACLVNNSFNDKCSSLKIERIGGNRRAFSSRLMLTPYFGQKTNLEWHVSQNEDKVISQYIIKHGTDEYEELTNLTIVPATATIGIESYSFLHERPATGENFYQIVVEYEDGSIDYPMYGDIIFDEALPITIAPNPARNSIKMDLTNYMDSSINYMINSIQGSQMLEGQYDADHNYIEELNLEQIPNGVYILYLQADNSRAIAVKFVVNKDS